MGNCDCEKQDGFGNCCMRRQAEHELARFHVAYALAKEKQGELQARLDFAIEALKWEEKRCGALHGPLKDALTRLRDS